jgi:Protein of unknown function (DUF3667)
VTIKAAGEALTGAMIGRAIEPAHREAVLDAEGRTQESYCLNCDNALTGSYCANCGQHAHVHRTLSAFGHDLLHSVFHFEGKVWRTIPLLFWNPGALTRRYIDGKRASYVSPLGLFLFSVFLMFATFESIGGPVTLNNGSPANVEEAEKRKNELREEIITLNEQRLQLEANREAAIASGQPTSAIDDELFALGQKLGKAARKVALARGLSIDAVTASAQIETGLKELDKLILDSMKNPKLLAYKLQSSAYKFAWAIIPLSLPFMWLLFAWKRQYRLYDHAVFVTYSITFIMLLLVLLSIARALGASLAPVLLCLPIHFFGQLRNAYALSFMSALWRTVALIFICGFVLFTFAAILLALGVSA